MKKGFTLIELLVVIAIIGILSSVVLAALNSARPKSRYASVIQQMKEIQTAAEMDYDTRGTYAPDVFRNINPGLASISTGPLRRALAGYMIGSHHPAGPILE